LSQQAGVTLFMTLLTAYKVLLYCYTQQSDILVGTPIANRTQTETEQLIGFFTNTLVLRTDLSGNPPISELLNRVRQVAIGAYLHQDLPFEKLVEELKIERNQSYSPLFQVWFVLHNTPIPSLELPGLCLTPIDLPSHTVKFDLMLSMWETTEGLSACFEYNSDLFEETTIARIANHFVTLLDKIVAQPEITLRDISASLTATDIAEFETANLQRLRNIKRKPLSSFKS
jgi:non-ribosomal peptide synthetase component F